MKIAFVLYSFAAGGVERMTLHLAEAFLQKGKQVDLLVIHPEGEYKQAVPKGVNLFAFGKSTAKEALPGMISYLRREQPDVVCSAKDYLNVLVIAAKKLSFSKAQLIVSCRVHLSEQARKQPGQFRRIKTAVRYSYRFADDVVGVSKGVAEDIKTIAQLPDEKVHVIYNPVVTKTLEEKMEQPVNHCFFEERNAKVIVTVGRLHVQKDYPTLLRAFANLQQNELPEARLLFIGDGEENEPLKKLAFELGVSSVVDFAGFQPNPYAYMKKAHLFALSSAWEGFGNVIVEALATGTPVVATDCPSGPREILADGKYGQLVPVGDTVALAQAMKDALLSHHDEAELISRAREFTVEACAAAYETLFR
ncbi:hypothetical protein CHH65_19170 [Shouchella clausii]|uniref:glycosyltransferase n=1 Tax=Shouchella clausii TaxID=79880 RepID=UPI000BA56F2E|nr:glycosyltransferase [Shouchella clausii]PAF07837.1 hypothetical protein CHH65_19170 [Shouchella clausii]